MSLKVDFDSYYEHTIKYTRYPETTCFKKYKDISIQVMLSLVYRETNLGMIIPT